jgi:small conductance mechanosensitive channel
MFQQINESLRKLTSKLQNWLDAIILNLPNLLLAVLVLTLSFIASRYLKKATKKTLLRLTRNNTVVDVLANIIVIVFMCIMLFIVLSILNLDDAFTALLGTAGVLGLAVGLALQDPLVNLFSGILMSVRENYSVGDLVETNGFFGIIHQITLRTTTVLTNQGQEVVIPNKDVLQKPLVNYTRSGVRRVEVECGVSYGEDLEKVKEVVLHCIKNSTIELLPNKPVELFFKEFGESSINFVLRFWPVGISQRDHFDNVDKAIIAIKKAFDANDIMIPFPIRTLDFGIKGGVKLEEMSLFHSPNQGQDKRQQRDGQ